MRLKDIPTFIRTTDPDDFMFKFVQDEVENCLKAPAIIFNTFYDLEHEVLDEIEHIFPNVYTVGPLAMPGQHLPESEVKSMGSNLWKEDSSCLQWLDKQSPGFVFYVNFRGITVMTEKQLIEFAWGLANSKHLFLWIIRPDVIMGDSVTLPQEFMEETKERSLISSWCAQDQVLLHPSVGGFLTHCGWNSILESISGGVPMVCWPFFAEQQTNCRYACVNWDIGMEIANVVEREEVEDIVREMMEREKGKKLREKASEWKDMAQKATKGGSSHNNYDRVIKEVLLSKMCN
ncbi:hypothetical protein GIB67_031366 [Kingdonia uniflora]|uniref:UDP-glycosyltransferases domain-containing protein n=1 Tax=Kingdonia uniflora TaxID=39325 RepID=A0A7J7MB78_9MAGN|nr:hypothetical protein GIB67_031366 [Kingdonia uniflora]